MGFFPSERLTPCRQTEILALSGTVVPGREVGMSFLGLITMDNAALTADKFAVAAIKAREVASLNRSYRADPKPDLKAQLNIRFDRLRAFLMTQFRGEPTPGDVGGVLANGTELSEEGVSRLTEELVPVALVRQLIKGEKISIDSKSLENWPSFMSRYQTMVLAA